MQYSVKSLNQHEMVVALSTHISESILHIHYDQVDEKNHKSLNTLVHFLEDSGYHDVAKVVSEQRDYIVVSNSLVAIRINDFINEHSAAIFSSIYHKGLKNSQAIDLIHKENPKAKEENITTYHKIKH